LGSVAVFVATVLASPEARACQYTPELNSAVPVGAEHPVNAAVILLGALDPELVTATIDGAPVTVVLDTDLSMESPTYEGMYPILALRFEPAPMLGQTVVVDGSPCGKDPEFCPPFHIEYVAVEPDETIADGDGAVEFDLIRYTTPLWGTSCNEGGSVIRTRPEMAREVFADEAFELLEVRAFHEESGLEDVIRMALPAYSLETEHVFDETIIGPAFPLEGWCVELTVRDAAGNADVLGTNCEACMYTENEDHDWNPPLMPIPGGPCDDGSASTSTGGTTDTSGGDESTGDPPDPTDDLPADSGPPIDDSDSNDHGGDTSGAPASDVGVTDRGCACTSSMPTSGGALLMLAAIATRRRRARRR
jgi:MYXO-CTERM domain-containing protein